MEYDLWYSERGRSGVLLHERDSSLGRAKWPDSQMIWRIDADTYAEAAENCDLVLSWRNRSSEEEGPVVPARAPSIRLTLAFYRDRRGQERHLPVPGWVNSVPALVPGTEHVYLGLWDHLQLVLPDDLVEHLGYLYLERPGRAGFDGPTFAIQAGAPQEMTVVDLRSVDGTERLWQEFDGRYEDAQEIRRIVELRLGSNMSKWTIEVAHILAQPSNQPGESDA